MEIPSQVIPEEKSHIPWLELLLLMKLWNFVLQFKLFW